jgi:hypothetical protein
MGADFVSFKPGRKPIRPPTALEVVLRVRALAKHSENIGWDSPHVQDRMQQRGVTIRQALEVLRKGECISGPKPDDYGDWRIKLRRVVAGRRVQVVMAVKDDRIDVVTVI